MDIYSHPLFLIQGKDSPPPEHAERFNDLEEMVQTGRRAYNRGERTDPKILALVTNTHSYVSDLVVEREETKVLDEEGETHVDHFSYDTAIAAVVTSIAAAQNRGLALVRPPGHHAHQDYTHGFCLLNNIAIAARWLWEQKGQSVCILDLDIHHGCGTQEIIDKTDGVHLFSIHAAELWPGEDHYVEMPEYRLEGCGPGQLFDGGNTTRIALEEEVTDARYARVLMGYFIPWLQRMRPNVVGISLGLDGMQGEEFGWDLTELTLQRIRTLLTNHPMFAVLEGGYSSNLGSYVEAFAR